MPRIFNTSWLAVILATFIFYMIGFVWYGFIFEAQWLEAANMTQEQADASMEEKGFLSILGFGLLITLAQALGLLWIINHAGAKRIGSCLSIAFWTFLMIGGPLLAYACLYGDYSLQGILIDYGHILLGWLAMATIYALFRGKENIAANEN